MNKKILNAINEIPICEDGKKAVKNLIKEIFISLGKEEEIILEPKTGEVWLTENGRIVSISRVNDDNDSIEFFSFEDYLFKNREKTRTNKVGGKFIKDCYSKNNCEKYFIYKIADSIQEFFLNNKQILSDLNAKFPRK